MGTYEVFEAVLRLSVKFREYGLSWYNKIMDFSKKFYFAFALLISVSLLSYFSFLRFRPGLKTSERSSVRGVQTSNPFDFIPVIEGAQEVGSNTSPEALDASYLISGQCVPEIHRFYSNVLTDKGWELEKEATLDGFEIKTYKKGKDKVVVKTSESPSKEECHINLVGFSSD